MPPQLFSGSAATGQKGCKELQKKVRMNSSRKYWSMHVRKMHDRIVARKKGQTECKKGIKQLLKKVYKKGCEELGIKECKKVAIN